MRHLQYGLILILALSALGITLPSAAHAATIRVPQDKPTIQAAIDGALANDTITVSPGTYLERLRINKPLHLVGAFRDTTIIDGQGRGNIITINASNVEIRGFTIQNSSQYGRGIYVKGANGVSITGNIIAASIGGEGISLSKANNTLVSNNIFKSNLFAVNATRSHSERIIGNQAVEGDNIGVQLRFTNKTLVSSNTFQGAEGVDLIQAIGNNVTRNLFKRMSLFGILLEKAPPGNTVFPENNTINENTFQGNHIGVDLQNATRNIFYHNDFFLSGFRHANPVAGLINSPNYWDNGTLGAPRPGGNYWDNYTGTDADGDGIGDTPYIIGGNNQDLRPLMTPFSPVPVLIRTLLASPLNGTAPLTVSVYSNVIGSLPPFTYRWDFGDGSPVATSPNATHTFNQGKNFTVTLTVGDTGGATDSLSTRIQVTAPPSSPSYTIPIILGVVVGAVAGIFLWRRWKKRSRASR